MKSNRTFVLSEDEIMADKNKALETAIAQIERQYGKGAIMRLGQ
ncbi:MAG: DNA recombination/repair protein RecA, partial [Clostridiales bacterium]|nr:DNA recombination/repair protein RecA [Clostridiales bacterium]